MRPAVLVQNAWCAARIGKIPFAPLFSDGEEQRQYAGTGHATIATTTVVMPFFMSEE
jgi:hypothetical protein